MLECREAGTRSCPGPCFPALPFVMAEPSQACHQVCLALEVLWISGLCSCASRLAAPCMVTMLVQGCALAPMKLVSRGRQELVCPAPMSTSSLISTLGFMLLGREQRAGKHGCAQPLSFHVCLLPTHSCAVEPLCSAPQDGEAGNSGLAASLSLCASMQGLHSMWRWESKHLGLPVPLSPSVTPQLSGVQGALVWSCLPAPPNST